MGERHSSGVAGPIDNPSSPDLLELPSWSARHRAEYSAHREDRSPRLVGGIGDLLRGGSQGAEGEQPVPDC